MPRSLVNCLILLCISGACAGVTQLKTSNFERLTVEVLAQYPHDRSAFTQGLLWYDGYLYESTGKYGRSSLKRLELETGKALEETSLSPLYFGEGLARIGRRLIQLTWYEQTALVYDLKGLRSTGKIRYTGEGWGLTYDGSWLVMSDGSDVLTFRDPKSFAIWRKLPVKRGREPVRFLNELEFAKGFVYANVWQTNKIVKIDPQTGVVTAVIDASSLPYRSVQPGEDVLNGIAYIPERDTFLITGKLWPHIFEVKFK
jgi:glutamine cyclotransferase